MMLRTLICAMFVVFASTVAAQVVPAPGPVDPRIRTVMYNPDAVISLRGHLGYQMMIEFDTGERIENVSLGDSLAWQVTPNRKATLLFIKPVARDAATNMTVVTNLRRYAFELSAAMPRGQSDPSIIFGLRFLYPPPPPPPPEPVRVEPPAPPPRPLNFAYSYSGSQRAAPARVYDDGVFTYFKFLPGVEAPAIFAIGADGPEGLVNQQTRDDHAVVDLVAQTFVLRFGNERAVVTNDAYRAPVPAADGPRRRREGLFGLGSR
jgi:type IV secretion system protein VirB9